MKTGIFTSEEGKNEILGFYERMLEKWPVEYMESDIPTSFGNTHVIISGPADSPPLVLLHGSTSNATTWAGDISYYSQHFRVYAPDMPGEPGKSSENRLSWENDDYPYWLSQLLDGLGIGKTSIAGLSLGGWAAMKFAASFPGRTGKIALIAPGGIVDPRLGAIFRLIRYQRMGKDGVERTIRMLFPDDFESPEVREFFSLLGRFFIARKEPLKKLEDSAISRITAPVLMVCGAKDAIFNFRKAEKRLKKLLPEAETLLFEKGTHGLVSMADTIIPFLKS